MSEQSRPPGNPNWHKGMKSPNPSGRPKTDGWFRELCRKRTKKALNALTAALDDPEARVAAAKALLEFAWGKAPAAGFAAGQSDAASRDVLEGLSRDERLAIARRGLAAH